MTEEAALLRAVIAEANDDTPRLAYADWLEEQDRTEEAEFIRLECYLASHRPDHPDYVEWQIRQEELAVRLRPHRAQAADRSRGRRKSHLRSCTWDDTYRGFPAWFDCTVRGRAGTPTVRAVVAELEKGFERLPTRWLDLTLDSENAVAWLAEFLRQPVVGRLEILSLRTPFSGQVCDDLGRQLADCPQLRNLKGLILRIGIGTAGAEALAASPHLGSLGWFACDTSDLEAEGMRALVAAPWFRNLRILHCQSGFGPGSFEELCAAPPLPHLQMLTFDGMWGGAWSWGLLARSTSFPRLANLELFACSSPRPAPLLHALRFPLSHLSVRECEVDNEAVRALASSPVAESLRSLDLGNNRIRATGALALGRSKRLTRLKRLELGGNPLGTHWLPTLAGNPTFRGLLSLGVGHLYAPHPHTLPNHRPDRLGGLGWMVARLHLPEKQRSVPEDVDRFLARLDMPQLRSLCLAGLPLGPQAVERLGDPKFCSLRRLGLMGTGLTDDTVGRLLSAPALEHLIELDLSRNPVTTGLLPLANRQVLPRLTRLIWDRHVGREAIDRPLEQRFGLSGH